jgi:hypothetical protein
LVAFFQQVPGAAVRQTLFHFTFVAAGGERFADGICATGGVFIATRLTGRFQTEALAISTADFQVVVQAS